MQCRYFKWRLNNLLKIMLKKFFILFKFIFNYLSERVYYRSSKTILFFSIYIGSYYFSRIYLHSVYKGSSYSARRYLLFEFSAFRIYHIHCTNDDDDFFIFFISIEFTLYLVIPLRCIYFQIISIRSSLDIYISFELI